MWHNVISIPKANTGSCVDSCYEDFSLLYQLYIFACSREIMEKTNPHNWWDFCPRLCCKLFCTACYRSPTVPAINLKILHLYFVLYCSKTGDGDEVFNTGTGNKRQSAGRFRKWKEWVVSQAVRCPKWVSNATINTDTLFVRLTMAGSLFRGEEVI